MFGMQDSWVVGTPVTAGTRRNPRIKEGLDQARKKISRNINCEGYCYGTCQDVKLNEGRSAED